VTYRTGALYVHHLWFYKHQHDNRVLFQLSVACQRWWFQWRFWFVPSVPGYLRVEEEHKPHPWRNPIERNHMGLHLEKEVARRVASDHHRSHARFIAAVNAGLKIFLINCAPSGEMHNYCTPHIIKWNFDNFLIHRCNYIHLSQVYCVWQVVKTPTIIFNNPVYRVSQEERTKLRESVPYVKLYRYNPKHLYPKLNGYGDNGQRKVWTLCISA